MHNFKFNIRSYLIVLLQFSLLNLAVAKDDDFGKYYAVVIGIDTYSGSTWSPLNTAVNDAKSIASLLKERYGFDEVITLYNEQATRAHIMQDISRVSRSLSENDNLLIYYSGHGLEVAKQGYWVPVDAKTKEMYELVPNTEIRTALAQSKCKHTLLIVDACFSGTIFRAPKEVPLENTGEESYYRDIARYKSRQALTSGGLEPVPDCKGNICKCEHSVFACYLLRELRENEKPYVDVGELFEQIKVPVSHSAPIPRYGYIKDVGDEGGQFIFRLASACTGDRTHVVQDGENLRSIAHKYYADPDKWKLLYDANKRKISRSEGLQPGICLVIPLCNDCPIPNLKIVTGNNFVPYTDQSLENGGMITEIVELVFREMGKTTTMSFRSWDSGLKASERGEFAAAFPYYKSTARKKDFFYSDPLYKTVKHFFKHSSTDIKYDSPEDVAGKIVIIPEGYTVPDEVQELADMDLITLKKTDMSLSECFILLAKGKADLIPLDPNVGWSMINASKALKSEDFQVIENPIGLATLHLIMPKTYPEAQALILEFNLQLKELKGQIDVIKRRHLINHFKK